MFKILAIEEAILKKKLAAFQKKKKIKQMFE